MDRKKGGLEKVSPQARILLLPHCLRRTDTCKAKYDKSGLQCVECNPNCPVNILRSVAMRMGYKGVCVSPGGSLAVKYVKEMMPKAIVAVACDKELKEGVEEVSKLSKSHHFSIVIVIVPLVKDGCIDTEVNIPEAVKVIESGCLR